MKVGNVIMAHKNPDQLLRLVNQYDKNLFHHFIHIDKKKDIKQFEKVLSCPHVTALPNRRNTLWGSDFFVLAALDAFRYIKQQKERFFYISLISGQDFPIKPTKEFYDFLLQSYHNGKGEYFEISDLQNWPKAPWFERIHLTRWTIRGKYSLERIINAILPKRKFYYGQLVPYGKSAWFTASDDFIDYALQFVQDNPRYVSFFKTVLNTDEFFFNTILMNSRFKDSVKHSIRYIDWSEGKINPKLLLKTDFNAMTNSSYFLARKFDEDVDAKILDLLENYISKK
jgi:Core-2/I-Branching enzyme